MLTLPVPEELDSASGLHTEDLEPVPDTDLGTMLGYGERLSGAQGLVVSIGQPQSWPLPELYRAKGRELPPEYQLLTEQADFWLVRLACSFRPRHDIRVDRARFDVTLHGVGRATDPIAFDLHPLEVSTERGGHVKVAITPHFKFSELEIDLGQAEVGLDYPRLEPAITGGGVLQPNPGWMFEHTGRHPLVGSRFMHLIVKCPRGARGVRATFDVEAEISKAGQVLRPLRTRAEDEAHRTAVICV